ncbi:MAG: 54S ribosomal protein L23, mitochondrial, partial [Tremellales sp. Tagirdzhanova-0007]
MSATKGRTALALTRVWHHASAQDRVLGKLASRVAWVLMGKHKPTYDPAVDAGDYVVVSDALQVRLTGKKGVDKVYHHHSGFISGLKEVPIGRMRERRPEE